MKRIALLLFASAALAADAPKLPSTEGMLVADPQQAKFNPVTMEGVPPGAVTSPIAVDPETKASIGYAKFPPGFAFPKHWHSQTEYTVLLAGTATFEIDGKPHQLVPGSYVVIPAKTPHQLHCGSTECLLLTRRAGATDYNWVK